MEIEQRMARLQAKIKAEIRTWVEVEREPSIEVDGSAITCIKVAVDHSLCHRISLRSSPQRSESVSTMNCHLLSLYVKKRRPAAVAQTCATSNVCCVGFPC
jgi:hypothetical protein